MLQSDIAIFYVPPHSQDCVCLGGERAGYSQISRWNRCWRAGLRRMNRRYRYNDVFVHVYVKNNENISVNLLIKMIIKPLGHLASEGAPPLKNIINSNRQAKNQYYAPPRKNPQNKASIKSNWTQLSMLPYQNTRLTILLKVKLKKKCFDVLKIGIIKSILDSHLKTI